MIHLQIALSSAVKPLCSTWGTRSFTSLDHADLTTIGAALMTEKEAQDKLEKIHATGLSIPVFVFFDAGKVEEELPSYDANVLVTRLPCQSIAHVTTQQKIDAAIEEYENTLLPPFFKALTQYVDANNQAFDCPGHHGGQFFYRHPTGRAFYDFFGETLFKSDLCNADVALGDLLIHEGPPLLAEEDAARIFHADKTYFVLNGTSASNKMVLNALLTPGDIVLYDRNNHKSICHGGLIQGGATPVYLETARNAYGSIGGVFDHCFNEDYIRQLIGEKDPQKATKDRPIRLAVIQLGTYDGVIYNARQVVDRIGHLCDYILFDSAWVGYEQFIPMLRDCSPMLLDLGPHDPGIIVTQSVHKQQAGFSQTSQVHKKDSHIKGQSRYVDHKRLNNAFMMHASTSPFYPLFAALDVNAKIHEGKSGQILWNDCVKVGIEARKDIFHRCAHLRPFVPPTVHGKPWADESTERISQDLAYFSFSPQETWHSFKGYGAGQYSIDPCKLQIITPGINAITGAYDSFGVPATILAHYLREQGIIPEKCDLNTILFLLTPAETKEKMTYLVDHLVAFEQCIASDTEMKTMLPSVYRAYEEKYQSYGIRQLCQEMHDFYKNRHINRIQQKLFQKDYFPVYAKTPQKANLDLVRGHGELVPLSEALNRTALEGALPYPPGVICVQPGERWSETALTYFLALEEGINEFPGFAPEIQGVYLERDTYQKIRAYAYVLQKEFDKEFSS